MSNFKSKTKSNLLNRVTSDSQVQKSYLRSQKLTSSSRSDLIDKSESVKDLLFNIRSPHKAVHYLNLQIPSLNSPANNSGVKSKTIKGKFSYPKTVKSSRATSIRKKKLFDFDSFKVLEDEPTTPYPLSPNELEYQTNIQLKLLENEIRIAAEENKALKKRLENEKIHEDQVEDLMKNFKSRLFKILYE
jgi:hypothetical protein